MHVLDSLNDRIAAFMNRGDPLPVLADEALAEAATALALALQSAPGLGGLRQATLTRVGWLHWCRYLAEPEGSGADQLELADHFFAQVAQFDLRSLPPQYRARRNHDSVTKLAQQAKVILLGAETGGDDLDVQRAEELLTRALNACRPQDPGRPEILTNLGSALLLQYERTQRDEYLTHAVDRCREAVELCPIGHLDKPTYHANLGIALRLLYDRDRRMDDLESSISNHRESLRSAHPVHRRDKLLIGFFEALKTRILSVDLPAVRCEEIRELIRIESELERILHSGSDSLHHVMLDTFVILLDRWDSLNGRKFLDEAARIAQEMRRVNPAMAQMADFLLQSTRVASADSAGSALNLEQLEDLVSSGRNLLHLPHPSGEAAVIGIKLAQVLCTRFELTGDVSDLDESIETARTCQDDASVTLSKEADSVLCVALRIRFEQKGDPEDIMASVDAGRSAAEGAPTHHQDLNNLGVALRLRFERYGDHADANAAIDAGNAAVHAVQRGSLSAGMYLSNLGLALRVRAERLHRSDDAEEAIKRFREARGCFPEDHHHRGRLLNNLMASLQRRYRRVQDISDLHEAIQLGKEAVATVRHSSVERALFTANLGAAFAARHEVTQDPDDLDDAIQCCQEAVEVTLPGHPAQAAYLTNLAGFLYERHHRAQSPQDVLASLNHLSTAADMVSAPAIIRLAAARRRGRYAASLGWWSEATAGYGSAVGLMSLVAWRGVDRSDQERLLTDCPGLAATAAACALNMDDPGLSVELLEHGRGVMWSQLLEVRTDLEALRVQHPQLADELDQMRKQLNQ
ncbi:hypothetical protein AB0G86_31880 [Streptomyces scabiei]|uniref:hypothetical protein n=1 Tax=Streptomyces scabiei TaxID=1930 RepID=UPI0033C86F6E